MTMLAALLAEQRARGVKTGAAASVPKTHWDAAEICPAPATRCFRSANGKRSYCGSSHRPDRRAPAGHAVMLATKRRLPASRLNHCSTTTSRKRPDLAGHHRTQTRSTPDSISAGQGSFVQVVAGVGFEPT